MIAKAPPSGGAFLYTDSMTPTKKATIIIFATVLIDMIGMTIILPALPIYVEKFSTSTFTIGMVYSIFAAAAFIAGPILGSLSDRYGRRPILIASIFGTSLGWVIFALAGNIWVVFLSRIIDGLTAGNVSVAQSYLTDIAKDDKDRTLKLGLIPMCIGIGFIMGPGIGGLLTKISPVLPFWTTAGLALLNAIAAYFFLPESLKKSAQKEQKSPIQLNPFKSIIYGLTHKKYRTLILLLLATSMSFESYHAMFIPYLHKQFGFDVSAAGLLLSGIGVMIAFNQLVLMKHFWLHRFKPFIIQLMTATALILIFALAGLVPFIIFLGLLAILGLLEGTLSVINGSELAAAAEHHERGKIIGISHSLIAISQVAAPAISGFFMDSYIGSLWLFSAFWMMIVFVILLTHKTELRNRHLEPELEKTAQQ